MDGAFNFAEDADRRIQADNDYVGIVRGLDVVEAAPTPNMTVQVLDGVAYDQTGRRCFVPVDQVLDITQDSNGVPTAVANPGNEKWLSIFIAFDRVLSDPRVDGNGVPLQYLRAESFQFILDQGAENTAGTAAVYTSGNSEPFALTNGATLEISVDGQAPQTVTFNSGDFSNIAAATAAEVAAVITAQVVGVTAADSGGAVAVTSASTGPGASIFAAGGSVLGVFDWPLVPAVGAGGPTRPALRPDALLLADVLVRFGSTSVVDKPDPGGSGGVIDMDTRRETVFEYNGFFSIKAGTITEYAAAFTDALELHIATAGNAHPATAITFDPSAIPADWSALATSPTVQLAFEAVVDDLSQQAAVTGASLVGASATAGPDLTSAGTVQQQLAAVDAAKGSLANANSWAALNTFTGGARVESSVNFRDVAWRLIPRDAAGGVAWVFVRGGQPSPIRKYGVTEQHSLTASPTIYTVDLFDGTTAPIETLTGRITGRVHIWDDNSNPTAATSHDFSAAFYLSAGVNQTVVFDEAISAALETASGATNLSLVQLNAPALSGRLELAVSFAANAGQTRNIAVQWELEVFNSNQ